MGNISRIFTDVTPISDLSGNALVKFDPIIASMDFTNSGERSYSTNSYTIYNGKFDIEIYRNTTVNLGNGAKIVFVPYDYSTEVTIYNANNTAVWGPAYISRPDSHSQGVAFLGFALGQTAGYSDGVVIIYSVNLEYQSMTFMRPTTEINDALLPNVTPDYDWHTWPQLAGNSGQFLLNLSQIASAEIDAGTPQFTTQDGSIFTLESQTLLRNFAANMLDGVEYPILYCGDNYATGTRTTTAGVDDTKIITLTIKFYYRSDVLAFTASNLLSHYTGAVVSPEVYLAIMYDNTAEVAAVNVIEYYPNNGNYKYNLASLPSEQQMHQLWVWLQDNGQEHEHGNPYDTGSEDNGGNPGVPRPQDDTPDTQLPTTSGLELGFITLYKPSDTQLGQIATFLWSDNVLDNFKKYFNNFADNILSLYVLPYTPSSLPTKTFKVGNMISNIAEVPYCTARYFDEDMGEVEVLPRWGSCLDYNPYTKIEIYLPYLGLHSLDIDEIMSPAKKDGTLPTGQGCTLKLKYRLDILTGVIVAKIFIGNNVKYQFEGKVGATIPLTGQTYAQMVNGIVTAGAGLVSTIATGGLTAPLAAAASVSGTINASKAQVERIGNISGDASMLALDYPYIMISSPNKPMLEEQEKYTGFPSYKAGLLSGFDGYTEVITAHVDGISCTEEERVEIIDLLKGGVII